jgi:hypothetical protein
MKKTFSQMNMTEATAATNALGDILKRGNVYINDSQIFRLAQLNFTPESNQIKDLLNRDTTASELLENIDNLGIEPEVSGFDRLTQF